MPTVIIIMINNNKHSKPVTVIVKRIAKKIKSRNLKNGF